MSGILNVCSRLAYAKTSEIILETLKGSTRSLVSPIEQVIESSSMKMFVFTKFLQYDPKLISLSPETSSNLIKRITYSAI